MSKKTLYGFTLVELIVSITILAILATIAYISLVGYSKDARNSSRVSDVRLIEKALSLFISVESLYPFPDNGTNITYSGSSVSFQGVYGTGLMSQVGRISQVPIDPTTGNSYTYGITADRSMYQLGSILEGSLFAINPIISQTYALDNINVSSYTIGDYSRYDAASINSGSCSVVMMPSILLSEIPAGGILLQDSIYKYSYKDSPHLPSSYSGSVDIAVLSSGLQLVEVLEDCRIDTLAELELYIAQLSTAYQPLSSHRAFEQLIFYSDTNNFQKIAITLLQQNGIEVDQSIIDELNAPLPDQVFIDTFTGIDNTLLIGSHTPDSSSGSWSVVTGGNTSAYSILGNTLVKSDNTPSLVYPDTSPNVVLPSYSISFEIEDFASGNLSAYLRYIDDDNYYRLDVTSTGYQLIRRLSGVDAVLQNITEPINTNSTINFSIHGDTLNFGVDDIQKESILVTGISMVGVPAIYLHNSGASIDNFTLTYK